MDQKTLELAQHGGRYRRGPFSCTVCGPVVEWRSEVWRIIEPCSSIHCGQSPYFEYGGKWSDLPNVTSKPMRLNGDVWEVLHDNKWVGFGSLDEAQAYIDESHESTFEVS